MSTHRHRGNYHRRHKNDKKENSNDLPDDCTRPILQRFKTYQLELDAKHDKHERLVKKSRDITIESKRIIFLLHRVTSSENNEEIMKEAEKRLSVLYQTAIKEIAMELNKREVYQYLRAFTAGLQEFVEAVSFYHYLKNGNVISIEEVYNPAFLVDSSEEPEANPESSEPMQSELPLSDMLNPVDFVLGVCDLTGELMRKCINSVGSGDIEEPFKLSLVLQGIHEALVISGNHTKELKRKLYVLKSSLLKVENACYAIKIRGTETPRHMLADFFSTGDEEAEAHDI